MLHLRAYQEEAKIKVRKAMMAGMRSVLLQASCGAGKTIISADVVKSAIEKRRKVLFLVNRRDLVKQTVEKYQQYGLTDHLGVIMAGEEARIDRPVQIASLQTYGRRLNFDAPEHNSWFHQADLVVYDECFVAGTMVDGMPIENLRTGMFVNSFNHDSGAEEKKRILNIFKSKPRSMCSVRFSNGVELVCTEDHPIFSGGQYLRAIDLCDNNVVKFVGAFKKERKNNNEGRIHRALLGLWNGNRREKEQQKTSICLQGVQNGKGTRKEEGGFNGVFRLWCHSFMFWIQTLQVIIGRRKAWCRYLFGRMHPSQSGPGKKDCRNKNSRIQQNLCIRENESQQPNDEPIHCGKDDINKREKRHIPEMSGSKGREWEARHASAKGTGPGAWVGHGSVSWDKSREETHGRHREGLQAGRCEHGYESWDRNRWSFAQRQEEGFGCKKRSCSEPVRVESVKVYKQTSDGRFGGVCRDGFVYNIEVEGNNNYFANGVLVHNCHSCNARTYKKIIELYKDNAFILGLSATPMRGDGTGLGEVFDTIIECIPTKDLIQQGHLVPMVYYAPSAPDLRKIRTVAGDYDQKELGVRVDQPRLIGDIYDNWMRYSPDRQTIIFAVNVKHSKHIRDHFRSRGVAIEHIDAHTPDEEREEFYYNFEAGNVQVMTNVGIATEGSDLPYVSAIVIARPTRVLGRWLQMAGRGARPAPGKSDCILLDHAGCVDAHGFIEDEIAWSLDGRAPAAKKVKKKGKKEPKPLVCEVCRHAFKAEPRCPKCGTEVKDYGKKIEAIEADLVEVGPNKRVATMEEKARFYGMLEYVRRERGYKPGWVANQYKAKHRVWPKNMGDVAPIEPDKAFRNWITYQLIKYAKSQQRKAGGSMSQAAGARVVDHGC